MLAFGFVGANWFDISLVQTLDSFFQIIQLQISMHSLTLVETKTCSLFQVENSSNEKEFFLAVGGAFVENNYSNVVLRADSKNRNISSSITTSEASLPNSVFVCSKVAAVDGQTVSLSIKALHGNNYPGPLTFPINSSNEIMAFYYNIGRT